MRLVTVATHNDGYFEYLTHSCKRFGADLVVLGWEQPWTGFSFKYRLLQIYLKDVPDSDVVCFVDAFDVVMLRSMADLEKSFLDFSQNTGARVILGYDRVRSKAYKQISAGYFGTCHGYPINSGTYLGYVKDLRRLLNVIYSTPELDDQVLLVEYCQNNLIDLFVDSSNIFFLTINDPTGPGFYEPTLMKIEEGNLWHRGVRPFFAHGNGNTDLNVLLKLLGYPMTVTEEVHFDHSNQASKMKKFRTYVNACAGRPVVQIVLVSIVVLIVVVVLIGVYFRKGPYPYHL